MKTWEREYPYDQEQPSCHWSAENYTHVSLIKVKGRKKKTDPKRYYFVRVAWDNISHTELMALCKFHLGEGVVSTAKVEEVVHKGLSREQLIDLITGDLDMNSLPMNPHNVFRERLGDFFSEWWDSIYTTVKCNTNCGECLDAQTQECVIENKQYLNHKLP